MPYADPTSAAAVESRRRGSRKYYQTHREAEIARAITYNKKNRKKILQREAVRRSQKIPKELVLFRNAQNRAKAKGIPFDLTPADISVPEKCPILGIPLVVATGHAKDGSPSIDRINPSLGYVRGNIQVISHRANSTKNNATVEEIRLVLKHMEECDAAARS